MCYRIFDHTFLFQLLLLVLGFRLVLLEMFKNVHKNQMFIAKASMLPYKWRKMNDQKVYECNFFEKIFIR